MRPPARSALKASAVAIGSGHPDTVILRVSSKRGNMPARGWYGSVAAPLSVTWPLETQRFGHESSQISGPLIVPGCSSVPELALAAS